MQIDFFKYHGTGNDFILIDNRKGNVHLSQAQIAHLCHRHFGIGADGLMLLENANEVDFKMVYYNSDGKESSMCGNGGRCITLFAKHLGIIENEANFIAIDGMHFSTIDDNMIELKMNDVHQITRDGDAYILNTGSPHYVAMLPNVKQMDVVQQGKAIRYNDTYKKEGINVNFVEVLANKTLFVATYERGVEDETLSCGTGVTAAAIAHVQDSIGGNYVRIQTKGGTLLVKCVNQNKQHFTDVYLCGPAQLVFKGSTTL
jgi:diaminopimelate epimerase